MGGTYIGVIINSIFNILILLKLLSYSGGSPVVPGVFFLYSVLQHFMSSHWIVNLENQLANYNRDILLKYGEFDKVSKNEKRLQKELKSEFEKSRKLYYWNIVLPTLINLLSFAQLFFYYAPY